MKNRKYLATLALCMLVSATTVFNSAAVGKAAELSQAQNAAQVKYGQVSKADQEILKNLFDYEYYKKMNPDVVKALGDDYNALFNHFVNLGVFEGRSCSQNFNVSAYASGNADLKQAFGNDILAYYRHFALLGAKEARPITTMKAAADAGITVTSLADPSIVITPQVYKVAEAKGITDLATAQAAAKSNVGGSNGSGGGSNNSNTETPATEEKKDTTNGSKEDSGNTSGGSTETPTDNPSGGSKEDPDPETPTPEDPDPVEEKTAAEKYADDKTALSGAASVLAIEVAADADEDAVKTAISAKLAEVTLELTDWSVKGVTGYEAGTPGNVDVTFTCSEGDSDAVTVAYTIAATPKTDAAKYADDKTALTSAAASLAIEVAADADADAVKAALTTKLAGVTLELNDWAVKTVENYTAGTAGNLSVTFTCEQGDSDVVTVAYTIAAAPKTDAAKYADDKTALTNAATSLAIEVAADADADAVKAALTTKLAGVTLELNDWAVKTVENYTAGTAGNLSVTFTCEQGDSDVVTVAYTITDDE